MEESLRLAEKLVNATNSALAQIKCSLMFDDWNGNTGARACQRSDKNLSWEEELRQFEYECKSETNGIFSYVEKLPELNSFLYTREDGTRASKACDKIKEINNKIEKQRSEETGASETERSREKLLSLINEKELKSLLKISRNSKSGTSKQISVAKEERVSEKKWGLGKRDPPFVGKSFPRGKSQEELKSKILETQEIVDRSFQTARQLTQKAEHMAKGDKKVEHLARDRRIVDKTPNSVLTLSSEPANRKCLSPSWKSESKETLEAVYPRRCDHRGPKGKMRRDKRAGGSEPEENRERKNVVVNVKRADGWKAAEPKLQLQRLPSLHIKGGLRLQKILSLEILPREMNPDLSSANTGVNILSHEQIKNEKTEKILEEVGKENCFCHKSEIPFDAIECFNCGKLIRIQKKSVDPREIDKILLNCDFNVYDPRIEEFVKKWSESRGGFDNSPIRGESIGDKREKGENDDSIKKVREEEKNEGGGSPYRQDDRKGYPRRRCLKLQPIIDALFKKYEEKANNLQEEHLQLETILRNLYDKVLRSSQFFDECQFFALSKNPDKIKNLTKTAPEVVSLKDDTCGFQKTAHKQVNNYHIFAKKQTLRTLDKNVTNKLKSKITKFLNKEEMNLLPLNLTKTEGDEKVVLPLSVSTEISDAVSEGAARSRTKSRPHRIRVAGTPSESSSSSSESDRKVKKSESPPPASAPPDQDARTENDYESDFEGESSVKSTGEGCELSEEKSKEQGDLPVVRCLDKLSTISEANSESEKKLDGSDGKGEDAVKKSGAKNNVTFIKKLDYLVDGIKISNTKETSDINAVLSKAFEKGIAYTLQHQRNILESPGCLKRTALPDLPGPTSASSKASGKNGNSLRTDDGDSGCEKMSSCPKSSESRNANAKKFQPKISPLRESSDREAATSLKEILSVLKDQVARTQVLANVLTENVKGLPRGQESRNGREAVLGSLRKESKFLCDSMINNLESARKDPSHREPLPSATLPVFVRSGALGLTKRGTSMKGQRGGRGPDVSGSLEGSLSERVVYSAREASANPASERKRKDCKSRSSSNSESGSVGLSSRQKSCRKCSEGDAREEKSSDLLLSLNSLDTSCSEGELTNHAFLGAYCYSTQSVGEVVSEVISETALFD